MQHVRIRNLSTTLERLLPGELKVTCYVSRCAIPPEALRGEMLGLVTHARQRNVANNVTGGLLCTGKHFAQELEGPAESVDAIIRDILRDERHAQVRIFRDERIDGRAFGDWSLAYNGLATFVDIPIAGLVATAPDSLGFQKRSRDVSNLIHEFAKG